MLGPIIVGAFILFIVWLGKQVADAATGKTDDVANAAERLASSGGASGAAQGGCMMALSTFELVMVAVVCILGALLLGTCASQ